MDVLTIRKNRNFGTVRHSGTANKGESVAKGESKTVQTPLPAVSKTLRDLVTRLSQKAAHSQTGQQLLQTGESALAEVEDSLRRMSELAQEAEEGKSPDRAALQKELKQLCEKIDRVLDSAVFQGQSLFQNERTSGEVAEVWEAFADDMETVFRAALEEPGIQNEVQSFPDWLLKGLEEPDFSKLLHGLGLSENARPQELLAAVANRDWQKNAAARQLAALYLGAVIAGGGTPPTDPDLSAIVRGLQTLLARAAETSLDEAVQELTNGTFMSISDFETQFGNRTVQGLDTFLTKFLLANCGTDPLIPGASLGLLSELTRFDLELLQEATTLARTSNLSSSGTAETQEMPMQQFGALQVSGQDLSGVSFDHATGVLTLHNAQDVTIQLADSAVTESAANTAAQNTGEVPTQTAGNGNPTGTVIVAAGSGTVTLRDVDASILRIATSEARIFSAGETQLETVELQNGATVILGGDGLLEIGAFRAEKASVLSLTGGAVIVGGGDGELGENITVHMDAPASLAARLKNVFDSHKTILSPFDIDWETQLPGWERMIGAAIDGKQARMSLFREFLDPIRLWLAQESDPSHGHPVHTVTVYGKDETGHQKTQYVYLHWDENTRTFQKVSMYPNPFTVTGGEEGGDWTYDEASHTLTILTAQVTGISGGSGIDAEQNPFSGRILLANQTGEVTLVLNGVDCRVSTGRAFDLGRENEVTLLLGAGTENIFVSGAGCAGISLEDGTSLYLDAEPEETEEEESKEREKTEEDVPTGTLVAVGGNGGAGIGRDSGGGWDRISKIVMQGGVVTAKGGGAGAGIGAGKHGFWGDITITGGVITAVGGPNGGAGIGGALGALVGDITLRGGIITASASYHAAAIGAGIEGECGNILITGSARIARAQGGDPGGDIGACIFGKCGEIVVSGGAEIGAASIKRWTPEGIAVQIGRKNITLPQFCLSARTLLLNRIDLSSRAGARTAGGTIRAASRRVSQIQATYNALCNQLEQTIGNLRDTKEYVSAVERLIRNAEEAGALLSDTKRSILRQSAQAMRSHSEQDTEDVLRLLRDR